MPEVSADFRTFTVRLKPGIWFQDDPAFKGQRREMVAADCLYQLKRCFDPQWKSPYYPALARGGPIGLEDLRRRALATGRFDYDAVVPGARTLDRYTFQITLAEPSPRFIYALTFSNYFGAVAREVVESIPAAEVPARPVGTGPFRLGQWRRGSFIALERNPGFRDEYYDATPAPSDTEGQEVVRRLRGKPLPMVDRIEISIIPESQPRWLAFLNGQLDIGNPLDLIDTAAPNGRLAPALARRGIRLQRQVLPATLYTNFNMSDPVVGGHEPNRVALRRAIAMAYRLDGEIRDLRRGQMIAAQSLIPPGVYGYDENFATRRKSDETAASANALLDAYGYLDRDGDGWREQPDGQPLQLVYSTLPSQFDRALNEVWRKSLNAIGVRVAFRVSPVPEHIKNARAGRLQMWTGGWTGAYPDAEYFLDVVYGPNAGGVNLSRFDLPAINKLYEQQKALPDGPARLALITELKRLIAAYQPQCLSGHPIVNTFSQPWLLGFRRHSYVLDWFKWVDVDLALRQLVLGGEAGETGA